MESKALALGKQVKAEALNSNVHQFVRCFNPVYPYNPFNPVQTEITTPLYTQPLA